MSKHGGRRGLREEELLELLIRATHRLSRHISDHLSGEFAAIDDVAVLLRTLCHFGTGNKLILRVMNTYQLAGPTFYYHRPLRREPNTVLEIAALPQLNRYEESDVAVTLEQWLKTPAMLVADSFKPGGGSKPREVPWNRLIADLANVRGSHASTSIAPWLEMTRVGDVNGISLPDYLIETVGVIVEDLLGAIMIELGEHDHVPAKRTLPARAIGINGLDVIRSETTLRVGVDKFESADLPDGEYRVFQMTVEGLTQQLVIRKKGGDTFWDINAWQAQRSGS